MKFQQPRESDGLLQYETFLTHWLNSSYKKNTSVFRVLPNLCLKFTYLQCFRCFHVRYLHCVKEHALPPPPQENRLEVQTNSPDSTPHV